MRKLKFDLVKKVDTHFEDRLPNFKITTFLKLVAPTPYFDTIFLK